MPKLPHPPDVHAFVVEDHSATAKASGGFVNVRRLEIAVADGTGPRSRAFQFDIATRRATDAAIIVAHYVDAGVRHVYLRSAPRPALLLHDGDGGARAGNLWEVAAGLIEPGESPIACATRELLEELGFEVDEGKLSRLGGFAYPAPGMIAEQHHYFHVEVDPRTRQVPTEDGSPLEAGALVIICSLEDALTHCRAGLLVDAKTELALRRLAEIVP